MSSLLKAVMHHVIVWQQKSNIEQHMIEQHASADPECTCSCHVCMYVFAILGISCHLEPFMFVHSAIATLRMIQVCASVTKQLFALMNTSALMHLYLTQQLFIH